MKQCVEKVVGTEWALNAGHETIAFAKLPLAFDHEVLSIEVNELLKLEWAAHVNQTNYDGGWDVLPLRAQSRYHDAHPILQAFAIEGGDEWIDLPILEKCPAISDVLSQLKCPLRSVRLMRLRAGAHIKPHRDKGLSLEYGDARLHIPIQTSPELQFVVDGQDMQMAAGELWYLNADIVHSVSNRGSRDRVNLVIDCQCTDWLLRLCEQGCRYSA